MRAQLACDKVLTLTDKIQENYSSLRIIFARAVSLSSVVFLKTFIIMSAH